MVIRINVWSGPRSLSTALMYSFGNRDDTQAVCGGRHCGALATAVVAGPAPASLLRWSHATAPQVDEPLYAYYLARNPQHFRPYRDKVLAAQSSSGADVVRDVILGPCDKPVLYLKVHSRLKCSAAH